MGSDIDYSGSLSIGSQLIISYVPQDTSHLRGSLSEYGYERNIDESLFKTILRKLGFEKIQFEKNIEDFSGGQKKKVLIAGSLCERAHLYIWDEPLNFIDVYSRMQIEQLITEYEPTMIFAVHRRALPDGREVRHPRGKCNATRAARATGALARPPGPDELDRFLEQRKVLLVVGRVGAVDLYPFPRALQTAGSKGNDVVPRELELGRDGNGQAQPDPFSADAGEHLAGNEIGVEAVDGLRHDAGQLEKQGVELRLAAGRGGVGRQGGSVLEVIDRVNESAGADPAAEGRQARTSRACGRRGDAYRSRI